MKNEQKGFVIAIDGPAAAGKGTIVQLLTRDFNGVNIYTGGMYRALALKCLRDKVDFANAAAVVATLHNVDIDLGNDESLGIFAQVFLDKEDVTAQIRTPEVALGAGKVAQIEDVRTEMLKRQRDVAQRLLGQGRIVIIDGQDAATHVYPEAEVKVFLTASQQERAKRRKKQYDKQGISKTQEEMVDEIQMRDKADWGRKLNPLSSDPKQDGYFIVDSTLLNELETKDQILTYITNK